MKIVEEIKKPIQKEMERFEEKFKEIKEAYVSAIGIEGNKQLSRTQKSMMPYRSRVIQPGIFIKEKLICAPTIESECANYLSFCGIKFIDFLMSH